MFGIFLDFFFPKYCYYCKKEGRYICKDCLFNYFNFNWEIKCYVCGKPCSLGFMHKECREQGYLDGLIYVTLYDKKIKEIIHDVKYNFYFDILSEISEMMSEYLRLFKFSEDFVLCDVPLYKRKLKIRGFNQSELLAKQIAKGRGMKYLNLLERRIDTVTQVGLNREDRENNLREAFTVKQGVPDKVLIIDDVFTSGSTLKECARVLKKSGASEVYGFVFAKSRE